MEEENKDDNFYKDLDIGCIINTKYLGKLKLLKINKVSKVLFNPILKIAAPMTMMTVTVASIDHEYEGQENFTVSADKFRAFKILSIEKEEEPKDAN